MNRAPKSLLILTNPGSRKATQARRFLENSTELRQSGIPVQWTNIFDPEPLKTLPDRVFVVGGDGTVRLAVNWLSQQEWQAPVSIIPAGTGNNLCKGLNFPLDLEASLKRGLHSRTLRKVDTISISADGESWGQMLQITATGLPARITQRFDRLRKLPLLKYPVQWAGDGVYRLLAIQSLLFEIRRNRSARLVIDEEELQMNGPAIFIGNEATIGGGFTPCPNAQLADGLLDVCILPRVSYLRAFSLFREVSAGRHLDHFPEVVYRQARKVTLIQDSQPILVDGDVLGSPKVLEFEIQPASLQLITGS